MKKNLFISFIAFSLSSIGAYSATTELLIRVQDDQPKSRSIKITIPHQIHDGPRGENLITCVDEFDKAITDPNGNFLAYPFYKTGKGETIIAPRLLAKSISSNSQMLNVQYLDEDQRTVSYKIEKDYKGTLFIDPNTGLTYDIPYFSRYPSMLIPRNQNGGPLSFVNVDKTPFFDAVSTFGIIWSVFDMYDVDIQNLGNPNIKLKWQNREKVRIFPHMTQKQFESLYPEQEYEEFYKNAFYDYRPQDKDAPHILCFFPMSQGSKEYTSQSFSVVAHEAGHNALNVLRPELRESNSSDLSAFHETFGDMTALFMALRFPELRERVLAVTKGNLFYSSFFSIIGKNIADRDATSCSTLSVIPSCEEHELSQKLTRALYSTFADFFNSARWDQLHNLDDLLAGKSQEFRQIFISTIFKSKLTSYIDFGRSLRAEAGEGTLLQHLVHTNFLRQGIDLTDILLSPQICRRETTTGRAAVKCSTRKVQNLSQGNHFNNTVSSSFGRLSLREKSIIEAHMQNTKRSYLY